MAEIDLGVPGLTDYKEIGVGGFAVVYSALESSANRRVAVKVLAAMDERGQRRFERECRTMGQTTVHDNIVSMFRSGYTEPDHRPYLVMEHMAGGSLQDRLEAEGPVPLDEALEIIVSVAGGLGFAHTIGIIHKDVKPANILISETGSAKLGDFGIAAIRDTTGTSQMAFSLLYTAPETFTATHSPDGGELIDPRDERSDLYSLAASLYALVTGAPPFTAASQAGLIGQILSEDPTPTDHPGLDEFLAVSLAKDPDHRFPTAAQFTAALQDLQHRPQPAPADITVVAPPASPEPTSEALTAPAPPGTGSSNAEVDLAEAPDTEPVPHGDGGESDLLDLGPTVGVATVVGQRDPAPNSTSGTPASIQQPAQGSNAGDITIQAPTEPAEPGPGRRWLAVAPTLIVVGVLVVSALALSNRDESSDNTSPSTQQPTTPEATGEVEQPNEGNDETEQPADSVVEPDPLEDSTEQDPTLDQPVTYTAHTGGVLAVVQLDNGLIASASSDDTVQIWDPADPDTTIATYTGHTFFVESVVQLDNGLIASASMDDTVRIWDPADPDTTIATYTGHTNNVLAVVQLDDDLIASAGGDNTVRI